MSRKNGGYIGYLSSDTVDKENTSGVYDISDHLDYNTTVPFNQLGEQFGSAVWPQTDNTEIGDPYLNEVIGGLYSPHLENTIYTDASGNWDEALDPKTSFTGRATVPVLQHQTNRYWSLKFSNTKRNSIAVNYKPEFDFGTGDFTIEFWYNPRTRADGGIDPDFYDKTILSYANSPSAGTFTGWQIYRRAEAYNRIYFNSTASGEFTNTLESRYWSPLQWVHYCFVRENGRLKLYENGSLTGNIAFTSNVTPSTQVTLKIGTNYASNTRHNIGGLLCDLRISNCAERLSSFTPPSLPIKSTPNTVLILSSDELCYHTGSNTANNQNVVLTNSGNAFRWPDTPYNYQAPAKEAAYKFIYSDAISSEFGYLKANIFPLLNDTSFTLETWFMSDSLKLRGTAVPLVVISPDVAFYPHETGHVSTRGKTIGLYYNWYTNSGPAVIVPNAYNSKDTLFGQLVLGGSNVFVKPSIPAAGNTTPYLETGEWHHLALTYEKESGNVGVYLNGVLKNSTCINDASMSFRDQKIYIGVHPANDTRNNQEYTFRGWIQDVTITKGVKYSANFIPTTSSITLDNNILFKTLHNNTSAFQYYTPAGTLPFDTMTNRSQNKLSYDPGVARSKELGPTYFEDKYIPDFVEETGIKKYERLASLFSYTGDYGVVYPNVNPTNTSLDFDTNPFTVEAWVYVTNTGSVSNHGIIGKGTATTGWGLSVVSNNLTFEYDNITITANDLKVEYGSWCHVVAQRSGTGANLFHLFVNGRLANVQTVTSNLTTQNRNLYLLNKRNPETSSLPFYGLINNLRLSNVARYPVPVTNTIGTVAFTPSMGPFNSDANTVLLTYQYLWSDAESGGMLDLGSQMNPVVASDVPYLRGAPPITNKTWSYVTRDGSTGLKLHPTSWNENALSGGEIIGSEDFSVEFFIQPHYRNLSVSEPRYIIDGRYNGYDVSDPSSQDYDGLYIRQNTYGNIEVGYNDVAQLNAVKLVSRTAISQLPVWYHVCVQRVNNNWALYINGIKEAEAYSTTNTVMSYLWTIWESGTLGGRTGQGWYGYFYGLRVCRGQSAYGELTKDNPESIPVPKEPLRGDIPGCVFMGFDRPFIVDSSTGGNGAQGGFVPVKVHYGQLVYTGRWEYAPSLNTPFAPKIMDWRHHYRNHWASGTLTYQIASVTNDDANDNRAIGDNFYYHNLFHTNWTMEGWFWVIQANNNVFKNTGTPIFSTLSNNSGNSALGGGILFLQHFYDGDSYGGAEIYGRMGLKWHHNNTSNPGFAERFIFYSSEWRINPGHNYAHFIIQQDHDSNQITYWVNGIRIYTSATSPGGDTTKYCLDGAYKGLDFFTGLDSIDVTFRAKYPYTLQRIPEELWHKPNKINKFTVLHTINNRAVSPVSYAQVAMRPRGYPKISRKVRNLGRPTIYLNQNSVTGAGGVWTASTPPWSSQSPTTFLFDGTTGADGRDDRFIGPYYQDFTIEGWFAWAGAASPNDKYIWELGNNIALRTVSGAYSLRFNNVDGQSYTSSANVSGNSTNIVFDHLVVQRYGSNLMLYVNGVQRLSIPISNYTTKYSPIAPATEYNQNINFTNTSLVVGADSELTGSKSWLGYLSDFRITRLARYETMLIDGVNTMVHRGTNKPGLPTTPFRLPITEIK